MSTNDNVNFDMNIEYNNIINPSNNMNLQDFTKIDSLKNEGEKIKETNKK